MEMLFVYGHFQFIQTLRLVYQTFFLFWIGLVMFFNSMNLDTNMVVAILGQDSPRLWLDIFRFTFALHQALNCFYSFGTFCVKQCSIEESLSVFCFLLRGLFGFWFFRPGIHRFASSQNFKIFQQKYLR